MNDTTPIRSARREFPGTEDRLEILRLVENGTITAEEAARLLDALADSERGPSGADLGGPAVQGRARHVRIRVSDSETEKSRVNLVLPLGLLDAGLNVARRLAPDLLGDTTAIRNALLGGARGEILDVDEGGERVQITVE